MASPETRRKLAEAKPRRRRVPPGPTTRLLERSYLARMLREIINPMIELMEAEVPSLLAAAGVRSDSLDLKLRTTIADVRLRFGQMVTRNVFERTARASATETNRQTIRIIRRQVKTVLGIDMTNADDVPVAAMLDRWVQQNVALIVTVEERYFKRIEQRILALTPTGTRALERGGLAEAITAAVDVAGRNAKFNAARIARDQVGKLKAQITEARQRDLGITEYTWDTVNDEAVRKLHADRDQRRFKWSEPPNETPDDGHPGIPIQCRCVAVPVFSFTPPEEAPSRPITGARPSRR